MNYQKYLRTHCCYLITFPLYIRRYQTAEFNKILSIPLEQRQSPSQSVADFAELTETRLQALDIPLADWSQVLLKTVQ